MPLQPASHVHAATAWRVPNEGVSHTPWFEQPFGHFGLEQSKPPQPGAHRQEPGATQRPREEQPDAQCAPIVVDVSVSRPEGLRWDFQMWPRSARLKMAGQVRYQ